MKAAGRKALSEHRMLSGVSCPGAGGSQEVCRKLREKLNSRSGESITEVLAATLVVALGSILLASMVIAANRLIDSSKTAYENLISELNEMEETPPAGASVSTSGAKVSITSESTSIGTGTTGINIPVNATEDVLLYTAPVPVRNDYYSQMENYYRYAVADTGGETE